VVHVTTIRVAVRHRFTAVDRRAINDTNLSFRARGLLVWLLDKPDGWRVNSTEIAQHCKEGRDAIRACLSELEAGGYLSRERVRTDAGKWITESVLREIPDAWESATEDGKPGVGKPGVGFPGANTKTGTDHCNENFPPHPRTGSRGPVDNADRVEQVIDAMTTYRINEVDTQPRNPTAYRKHVREDVECIYGDLVRSWCAECPELDVLTLARRILMEDVA
jgi:hypothetical protein